MSKSNNSEITRVVQDVRELRDQIARVEQVTSKLADNPSARMERLVVRLRLLIANRAQYQCDTDWADIEDIVENELGPVKKRLPKGLYTKVSMRLRESRELLRRNAHHGAAINQMREVETLLANAIDVVRG